tara:strand:- start:381 stop:515 length:135 start_codon:yes stop_codon:yes gene_type:complete
MSRIAAAVKLSRIKRSSYYSFSSLFAPITKDRLRRPKNFFASKN